MVTPQGAKHSVAIGICIVLVLLKPQAIWLGAYLAPDQYLYQYKSNPHEQAMKYVSILVENTF